MYTRLTAEVYREVCEQVGKHRRKKARRDEIINEIAGLRARPDIFVQGGDGIPPAERAVMLMDRARKKFYTLFEDVDQVEAAFNDIIFLADNEAYGQRLCNALLLNCEDVTTYKSKVVIRMFNLKQYGQYITPQDFNWEKRRFISNVASRMGYIGGVEMLLVGW